MSIFTRPIRPEPMASDEAVRRYIEAIRREIEPDPMFRRRLRGTVVNRFVAEREGTAVPAFRPSRMGRLGRACLYASLATALSVGGVMAASETAVPGDFLYPLKRSIEEMRMEVAPAQLRDDLAVYALAERIDELDQLVERGAWTLAADLAGDIRATSAELTAGTGVEVIDEQVAAQLARLDETLDRAPVGARDAIERAMGGAPGPEQEEAVAPGRSEGSANGQSDGGGPGDARGSGNGTDPPHNDPPGQADRTPRPEPSPDSDRGNAPDGSPQPERSPKPDPTPKPKPTPMPSPSSEAETP
jgi:Domain of unknown function (DUF5667)